MVDGWYNYGMNKNRLEAFSDGVIAIIVTIMVLEIKIPHSTDWREIFSLYPIFISYGLSFLFVCIYWVNHHHLIHTVKKVNSNILWTNATLLFFLSLIPWGTGLMGENHFEKNSVIIYTLLCFLPAVAFSFLSKSILSSDLENDKVRQVLMHMKKKEYFSQFFYALAISTSFIFPYVSLVCIFLVSSIWVIPNRQIEKMME